MLPKYRAAVNRIEKEFDIKIISAPNSLRGKEFLKKNPKAKADDLIWALENKNVSGIISNIGGNDSIDILPFIDIKTIEANCKVFIGCSDIFNIHTLFYRAGVVSFYGGNLLTSFCGKDEIDKYYLNHIGKALFDTQPIGEIVSPDKYCIPDIPDCYKNDEYETINGAGIIKGKIFICTSELITIQNSEFSLPGEVFENAILCFEDIVECVSPSDLHDFIIGLHKLNIMQKIKALVIAKFDEYPQNHLYKASIIKALNELSMNDLPVITGFDFGHTLPKIILPYGVMAEINLDRRKFNIAESAVI